MASVPSTGSPLPADLPDKVADQIVDVIDKVRDRTTGTVISVSGKVVAGLLYAVLALVLLVLACVLLDRAVVILVRVVLQAAGWNRAGRANWIADLVLALLFAVAGFGLLVKKANRPATP